MNKKNPGVSWIFSVFFQRIFNNTSMFCLGFKAKQAVLLFFIF